MFLEYWEIRKKSIERLSQTLTWNWPNWRQRQLSNDKYPGMLAALSALCKSKTGKFALTNFLRCDFRGLKDSFKPGFEDAISILSDDFKNMTLEMNDLMREKKCACAVQPLKNTTLFSQWKVNYTHEGKAIYSFHSDVENRDFCMFQPLSKCLRNGLFVEGKVNPSLLLVL